MTGAGSRARRDGVFFCAGVAVCLGVAAADPYARLDTLARVLSDVEAQYEHPVALSSLVDAALHGIGNSLDSNTIYYAPDEWSEAQSRAAGEWVGIGATLVSEACGLRVISVLENGPAARAGVSSGSCLTHSNDQPLDAGTLPTALEGTEGTAVRLRLSTPEGTRDVALLRGRITTPAVSSELLAGGVWHLRIRGFQDAITAEATEQYRQTAGVRSVILDLRGNPGGRVEEAVRLVDLFVGAGVIVTTKRRAGGDSVLPASESETDWTMPLVVLVDGDTASAGEIAAGALRDLGRAKVVGRRTFGKGSVQRQFVYDDGSALKLTVGRYYLPNGEPIRDKEGIAPDVVVANVDGTDDVAAARLLLGAGR